MTLMEKFLRGFFGLFLGTIHFRGQVWTKMRNSSDDQPNPCGCPDKPNCSFIACYTNSSGDCFCVYFCETPMPSLLVEDCP